MVPLSDLAVGIVRVFEYEFLRLCEEDAARRTFARVAAINFVTLIPGFKLPPCDIIWIGFCYGLVCGLFRSAFPGAKIISAVYKDR